ncbi:hypothetical protein A3SI_14474 [Nitritalea halalkaliphila LW7]|uniref:Uncharacterized protein n=1 Tax=Nitritalea halalkaliphila LW7 TaxID=1189621 RepID=I5BZP8_9BACT|nr:hypothetical protein A3SI_14474 [Nitritalea halalkaliphila LW7]
MKDSSKSDKQVPAYVKYIGLSFQLFGIIGGGTGLGWYLQQRSSMQFPLWLLLFLFFIDRAGLLSTFCIDEKMTINKFSLGKNFRK